MAEVEGRITTIADELLFLEVMSGVRWLVIVDVARRNNAVRARSVLGQKSNEWMANEQR